MLVVLALLFVAVDRVSAWMAGRVVADQVAAELADYDVGSSRPDVDVGGFPFLPQVVSGEYGEVTLSLSDVGAEDVRLSEVEIVATEVTASMSTLINRSGPIRAGRIDGDAVVGYQSVAELTGIDGLELTAAGDDTVAVELPMDLLGASVTLVGSASVRVDGHTLQLRVSSLGTDDSFELPAQARAQVDELARSASVDVALPPLPYDLSVDSARPEAAGIAVALSADDVLLSR